MTISLRLLFLFSPVHLLSSCLVYCTLCLRQLPLNAIIFIHFHFEWKLKGFVIFLVLYQLHEPCHRYASPIAFLLQQMKSQWKRSHEYLIPCLLGGMNVFRRSCPSSRCLLLYIVIDIGFARAIS